MASNDPPVDPTPPRRVEADLDDEESDDEFESIQQWCARTRRELMERDQRKPNHKTEKRCATGLSYMAKLARLTHANAVMHGRMDRIARVVEIERDLDEPDGARVHHYCDLRLNPFGLLLTAATHGHTDLVQLLCDSEYTKFTVRHLFDASVRAYLFGHFDICAMLSAICGIPMNDDMLLRALNPTRGRGSDRIRKDMKFHVKLVKAVLANDIARVDKLLKRNPRRVTPNLTDYHRAIDSAIFLSCMRGYDHILQLLFRHSYGCAWNSPDRAGATALPIGSALLFQRPTPMHMAVLRGDTHLVTTLMSSYPAGVVKQLNTCLQDAVLHHSLDTMRVALDTIHAMIAPRSSSQPAASVVTANDVDLSLCVVNALWTAITLRFHRVVRMFFERFSRETLHIAREESKKIDDAVQLAHSLPILRMYILWCPRHIKTNFRVRIDLRDAWPTGFSVLIMAGAELEGRAPRPEPGLSSRAQLSLSLEERCMQLVRLLLRQPLTESIESLPLPQKVKENLKFRAGRRVKSMTKEERKKWEDESAAAWQEKMERRAEERRRQQEATAVTERSDGPDGEESSGGGQE